MSANIRSSNRTVAVQSGNGMDDWGWKTKKQGARKKNQIVVDSVDQFFDAFYAAENMRKTVVGIKTGLDGKVYGRVGKRKVKQFRFNKADHRPVQDAWTYC